MKLSPRLIVFFYFKVMGFSLIFLRLNMKKLSGLSVSFYEDCEIGEVIFGISETDASRCFAKTVF